MAFNFGNLKVDTETYKPSKTSGFNFGGLNDRVIALQQQRQQEELQRKQEVVQRSLADAERYSQEAQKYERRASILETIKNIPKEIIKGALVRPAISLAEIPYNVATGGAKTFGQVNVPLIGPVESYQTEAQRISGQIIEDKKPLRSALAPMSEAILDIGSLGVGGQIIKQGVKQGLKQGVRRVGKATLEGGAFGAGYGTTESLREGQGLKEGLKSAAIGAGTGAALGASLSAASGLAGKLFARRVAKKAEQEIITNIESKLTKLEPEEKTIIREGLQQGLPEDDIVNQIKEARTAIDEVFKPEAVTPEVKPETLKTPKIETPEVKETPKVKTEDPLIQEARKGDTWYHGTDKNFTEFKKVNPSKGEAVYLSDSNGTKAKYLSQKKNGRLLEVKVNESKVKTFDPRDTDNKEVQDIIRKVVSKDERATRGYYYDPENFRDSNAINYKDIDDTWQAQLIKEAHKYGYNDFRTYEKSTNEWSRAITDSSLLKSQPLQEGVEKVAKETPVKDKTISPIAERINKRLDDASKINEKLDTTTHKKALSTAEKSIIENPEKAYNDAVFGKMDSQNKTATLSILLENAKAKGDNKAIAEIGEALAKHGRKSGQEVEMIKAMIEDSPTNKGIVDLVKARMNSISARFKKLDVKKGEDAYEVAKKAVKNTTRQILKSERKAKVSKARDLIRSLMC